MHIRLIVLFFAMVLATEIKVHHVTDIYTGKHEGDLFLQLNRAVLKGRKPRITQIDWCGSTQLNPLPGSKIVVREVKDCTEPGLLHARLFPSETRKVNQPHDAPDRLFINADFIGGWNSRRQGMIIVNVDIVGATGTSAGTGTSEKLIQKFRINPINVVEETNKAHHTQQPVDIVSEETIALPIVHDTQQQQPPQVVETHHASSVVSVVSVASVASVSPPPSLTIASAEGEEEEFSALSDWKGMLYLFASGMAAIILIVGATMVKRGTLSIPFLSARLNRHRHTRLAQNDVEMDDFGTHSMSSLHEDDDVVVDEYTNILMQLGTGATPAFKDNL